MTRPTLIDEDRIYAYCDSAVGERERTLREIGAKPDFPSAVLPVFEICRATYFGAVKKGINPAAFHDCWQNFVMEHWEYRAQSFPVTVASEYSDPVNATADFLELGLPSFIGEAEDDVDGDARGGRSEHKALTSRFRKLQDIAASHLARLESNERRAHRDPPEYLSELGTSFVVDKDDLVLDTNVVLEVLNQLSLTEPLTRGLTLSDRFSASAKARIEHLLRSEWKEARLIIPANVVEEAERISRKKPEQYGQAAKVIRAMLSEPDYFLWSAFRLVPLSMDFLGAFIGLQEILSETTEDKEVWPDFSDAIVLAHGLFYGCPVASAEWDDAGKLDWQNMDTLFPGLRI